eukprot:scaffold1.g5428.t1
MAAEAPTLVHGEGGAITSRVFARAGLLGNPSDGYGGKTIALSLANYYAEVTLRPAARLAFLPNPAGDPSDWSSLESFASHVSARGFYGGVRLLQATCKVFWDHCSSRGIPLLPPPRAPADAADGGGAVAATPGEGTLPAFSLSYSTTIPRQCGLAGSSAIACAALNCVLAHYGVGARVPPADRPALVLRAEALLGIAAGLQDRVVQVYGGLVHMDFGAPERPRYCSLDPGMLPPLYLLHWPSNLPSGKDSGVVHADVRRRWAAGDADVREGMAQIAALADEGRSALERGDARQLAALMSANFALRRRVFGDAAVGAASIRIAEVAASVGAAAKLTGSGGALLALCPDSGGQAAALAAACAAAGRQQVLSQGNASNSYDWPLPPRAQSVGNGSSPSSPSAGAGATEARGPEARDLGASPDGNGNGAGPARRAPRRAPKRDMRDANFPMDAEGRTYHLGVKRGEVAPRLLSVGPERRALLLAEYLVPAAPGGELFMLESSRGFVTITGLYAGQLVTIMSTHMGFPNIDFVVREARAVVDGPMAVLRLGTCGAFQAPAALGAAVVASPGAVLVRREPDAFSLGLPPSASHYSISLPVDSDPALSARLRAELAARLGEGGVCAGLNVSADSFYSSQGRISAHFDDYNASLIDDVLAAYPNALNMEMETFHLLDLARTSRGSIAASAVAIALACRRSNEFLTTERIEQLERACGQACLATLAAAPLGGAPAPPPTGAGAAAAGAAPR